MSLIFDRFPSMERAREFAAIVKERYGRDGQIFKHEQIMRERGRVDLELKPPIVFIESGWDLDSDRWDAVREAILKLGQDHGGTFAG
jgi:hypothetical protein